MRRRRMSSDLRWDLVAALVVVTVLAVWVFVLGSRAHAGPARRWSCWSEVNQAMPDGVEPMCGWIVDGPARGWRR